MCMCMTSLPYVIYAPCSGDVMHTCVHICSKAFQPVDVIQSVDVFASVGDVETVAVLSSASTEFLNSQDMLSFQRQAKKHRCGHSKCITLFLTVCRLIASVCPVQLFQSVPYNWSHSALALALPARRTCTGFADSECKFETDLRG